MLKSIEHNQIRWYDILKPNEKDLNFLKENFQFHPLDFEDIMTPRQRPKIDYYENYVFLIFHFPVFNESEKIEIIEIDFFIGKNYLITISERPHPIIDELFKKADTEEETRQNLFQKDAAFLFYNVLNKCAAATLQLVRKLGAEIDAIDKTIVTAKSGLKIVDIISLMRRNLVVTHSIIKPSIVILDNMIQGKIKFFDEKMSIYWDNIADYFHKISDNVDDYREFLEGLASTYDSLLTHRTNDTIKILTIFSVLILPLNLIAGIYGMNIGLPIQQNPFAFIAIIIAMFLISITMLAYFKFKKWID